MFYENQLHGYGAVKFSDGEEYKGYFKFGKKDGYGENKYTDGNLYWGEWKDDDKHGLVIEYIPKEMRDGF